MCCVPSTPRRQRAAGAEHRLHRPCLLVRTGPLLVYWWTGQAPALMQCARVGTACTQRCALEGVLSSAAKACLVQRSCAHFSHNLFSTHVLSLSRPAAWCRINKECTPQVYIFIQVGSLWLAVHWLCIGCEAPRASLGTEPGHGGAPLPAQHAVLSARSPAPPEIKGETTATQDVSMEGADGAENEAANEEGEGEPCHAVSGMLFLAAQLGSLGRYWLLG